MSYYHILYILTGGMDKMNFGKNKNEKGLTIGCVRCAWKIAILETDSINDINKFYREHKCINVSEGLSAPVFNPREILAEAPKNNNVISSPIKEEQCNNVPEGLSPNDLLYLILQELRDQKLQDKNKSYYIKKADREK
jgi:hypothetical protein